MLVRSCSKPPSAAPHATKVENQVRRMAAPLAAVELGNRSENAVE
jgi:hypothetical protein